MTQRRTIEVSGMSCNGCERNVENALKNVDGVSRVEAKHKAGTVDVVVLDDVNDDALRTAIHEAGYEVIA